MSDPQPKWRKVLVSGSNAHVAALTASAIADTHGDAESPGVEEKVLVYNTSSGAFYYTGSYGQGGGGGSGTPGGNDQNIQFNNGGAFDGDDGFIFDDAQDASLFVDGPITGSNISASGNISASALHINGVAANAINVSAGTGDVAINATSTDANCMVRVSDINTAESNVIGFVATGDDSIIRNDEGSFKVKMANNATTTLALNQSGDLSLTGNISASGTISASAGISASVATIVKDEDGGDVTLTVRNSNTDAGLDKNAGIVFGHAVGSEAGKILAGKDGIYTGASSTADSNLKFFTAENGTDNERLRISSNGNISASKALFISTSLSASHAPNNVVLVNTATGELYHTGSYGSGGGGTTPTLQQVTDQGAITTVAITASADISSSGDLSGNTINAITSYNLTTFPVIFPESGKFVFGQTAAISYPIGVTRITGSHIEIPTPLSASIISASETTFTKNLQFPPGASVANGGISFGSAGGDNGHIFDDGDNLQLGYNDQDVITIHDVGTNVVVTGDLKTTSHITASGNISASGALFASTSLSASHAPNNVVLVNTATGELYHTGSYGSGGGGGGGGVVTGYTNGTNNRVITSTGTSTINGEGGLLFDSTTNLLEVGASATNRITLSGASGTVQTTAQVQIGDNSVNTNVNAYLQFAPKSGGYYSGVFVGTDDMTSTFSGDGKFTGEIIEAPVASSITAGHILYLRSTTTSWFSALATAENTSTPMLAMGIDSATTNRAMSRGYIRVAETQVLGPTPNIGQLLYLSTGSAGYFQTLPPKTVGHVVRSVGYPINSLSGRGGSILSYLIYFNPSNDYIVA